jgi:flagellar biosynthesis protein FlhG
MSKAHKDQASGLRRLLARDGIRVMPVLGGAECLASFASAIAAQGLKVIVLDVSHGEALHAFNLRQRFELKHLLNGEKHFDEVALPGPRNVRIVAANHGIATLFEAGHGGAELFGALAALHEPPNLVILHCGANRAGLGCALLRGAALPGELVVFITDDATAVTAAYRQIKALAREFGQVDYRAIVIGARHAEAARRAAGNLAQAANHFFAARVSYGGFVPEAHAAGAPLAIKRLALASAQWQLAAFAESARSVDLSAIA